MYVMYTDVAIWYYFAHTFTVKEKGFWIKGKADIEKGKVKHNMGEKFIEMIGLGVFQVLLPRYIISRRMEKT